MVSLPKSFHLPPLTHTAAGKIRCAGFEFEYAGPDLDVSAQVIQHIFGGKRDVVSTFEQHVRETPFGDFTVEIDTSLLKEKKYERALQSIGLAPEKIGREPLERSLINLFSRFVPFEVSTPPIPITELERMEALRESLRLKGALGTRASLFYAFGFHINVELPAIERDVLLSTLRAFLLIFPWIQRRVDVDIARKLSPFINPFPADYTELILSKDYDPAPVELIRDYLRYNPTRNRPLDMLPIFCLMEKNLVCETVREPHLMKPRAAFHYRMPNCLIDEPDWSIKQEWNTWVAVERLASQREELESMAEDYLNTAQQQNLGYFSDAWPDVLETYMRPC